MFEAAVAAAVLACLFGGFAFWRKAKAASAAALAWGAYAIYESLMAARVLCSGECNIRVDLLLAYPLLLGLSLYGIVQALRKRRDSRS